MERPKITPCSDSPDGYHNYKPVSLGIECKHCRHFEPSGKSFEGAGRPMTWTSGPILTPEQKKARYYAVRCAECGWIGSSSDLDGGYAIPEAGDYDDTTCPKCHSTEINEIEDIKPRPAEVILAERYAHIKTMEDEIDRQQAETSEAKSGGEQCQ